MTAPYTAARATVKAKPRVIMLADGDMLVPVRAGSGWVLDRVSPDSPHYTAWADAYRRDQEPQGVTVELVFSFLLPPVALLFAVLRLARDEVGPGLALLLVGWLGTGLWVLAWVAFGLSQAIGS